MQSNETETDGDRGKEPWFFPALDLPKLRHPTYERGSLQMIQPGYSLTAIPVEILNENHPAEPSRSPEPRDIIID